MAEVQIFSREGTALTTITARAPREWVLNGVSMCTFEMSLLDPKCRLEYLQYGNIVLIEHPSLPPWVGLLDSDDSGDGRVWSSGNTVTVMALSAGIVFDYADLPIEKITGTAGRIYEKIIERVNGQQAAVMLGRGAIFTGGTQREETTGGSALEHVRRVSQRSGNDWDVTGEAQNGRITLKANWYASQGVRHDRLLTEEHLEFSDHLMRETGKIRNGMTGYGDASTNSARLSTYIEVDESVGEFGRRRASQVFSGNRQLSTLMENTDTLVRRMAYPRRKVTFSVVNENGLFDLIGLGNVFPFHLDHAGFLPGGGFGANGDVKVMAFGFDDATENAKVTISAEVL